MQELPFLHSARRLMLIDICMKFREDSLRGFQVTERTRFVTDRQTDRCPGKNNMSPNPLGGDIMTGFGYLDLNFQLILAFSVFMSHLNFVLSRAENEKRFITSRPGIFEVLEIETHGIL